MNAPLIKLEVEHMRQCMVHAFSESLVNMDAAFKESIAKVCTPENVQAVLDEATARHLKMAMEEEVRSFFAYGEGRKIVADQVRQKLLNELS
jgi:hypothetical protein